MNKPLAFVLLLIISAFTHSCSVAQSAEIKWMTLQEAEAAMKKKPKKIFVDIYTDWCGWCKRLDATTYKDAAVVEYINKNFYSVKLNAEMKTDLVYQGKTYSYDVSRKTNTVAAQFMGGSGGYPTLTYVDEHFKVISVEPGYVDGTAFLKTLKFYGDNYYLNMDKSKYLSIQTQ